MTSDQETQQLQEKVAFLEDTVEQLNEALAAQQKQLAEQTEILNKLKQRFRELMQSLEGGNGGAAAGDEKPPHY